MTKVQNTFGLGTERVAPLLSLDLTHVLLDLFLHTLLDLFLHTFLDLFLHTLLDLFLHTFLDLQGASTMLVEVKQQSCSLLHWAAKLPYRIVAPP